MGMFSGCDAVVRARTTDDKRKKEVLGERDAPNVTSDAIKDRVRALVATGKYVYVGGYWEKPFSDETYRVLEWRAGVWTE